LPQGLRFFQSAARQSHDESGFTCFRFDLDLTAMPVSHDALAYRKVKNGSKMNKKIFRALPFLEKHFTSGKPPFFRFLDANLIPILQVRKDAASQKTPPAAPSLHPCQTNSEFSQNF
jgi:hypothetical protein